MVFKQKYSNKYNFCAGPNPEEHNDKNFSDRNFVKKSRKNSWSNSEKTVSKTDIKMEEWTDKSEFIDSPAKAGGLI